jgi:hypothetical protein
MKMVLCGMPIMGTSNEQQSSGPTRQGSRRTADMDHYGTIGAGRCRDDRFLSSI